MPFFAVRESRHRAWDVHDRTFSSPKGLFHWPAQYFLSRATRDCRWLGRLVATALDQRLGVKSMLSSIMTLFIRLISDLSRLARRVPIVRMRWICCVCRRNIIRASTFLNIEILDTRHVEPVPQQSSRMDIRVRLHRNITSTAPFIMSYVRLVTQSVKDSASVTLLTSACGTVQQPTPPSLLGPLVLFLRLFL